MKKKLLFLLGSCLFSLEASNKGPDSFSNLSPKALVEEIREHKISRENFDKLPKEVKDKAEEYYYSTTTCPSLSKEALSTNSKFLAPMQSNTLLKNFAPGHIDIDGSPYYIKLTHFHRMTEKSDYTESVLDFIEKISKTHFPLQPINHIPMYEGKHIYEVTAPTDTECAYYSESSEKYGYVYLVLIKPKLFS